MIYTKIYAGGDERFIDSKDSRCLSRKPEGNIKSLDFCKFSVSEYLNKSLDFCDSNTIVNVNESNKQLEDLEMSDRMINLVSNLFVPDFERWRSQPIEELKLSNIKTIGIVHNDSNLFKPLDLPNIKTIGLE